MVKDLTTGRPMKVLWNFTLPSIGGNLFQLFYTLADTLMVGQTIGAEALAAVGATSIFVYFILCFREFCRIYLPIFVHIYYLFWHFMLSFL